MATKKIFDQLKRKCGYLASPLCSGLLLIFAYPPFEVGVMAWLALLPLLHSCLILPPRKAFAAGFVFALPFMLYLNYYLAHVLFPYLGIALGLTALIALILYLSLFYAFFALTASLAARHGKAWYTALAFPSLWVLAEYLRSLGFMAYNVGYLGYSQWSYTSLLGIAATYGYWGLPFIIVFFQTIAILWYRKLLRGRALVATATLFILIVTAGLLMPGLFPLTAEDQSLKVALIQNNSTPEEIMGGKKEIIGRRYLEQTRAALAADPGIELVVWPETVVDLDFRQGAAHYAGLIEPGAVFEKPLLYGARTYHPGKLYNTILLYKPGVEEHTLYHKQRLVPFVEFFPAEELLNRFLQLEFLLGRYNPGDLLTIFELHGHKFAGVICFESYFGDHTRLFAAAGAEHLFVLSNLNWFGRSIGLDQYAQAAAIRAAEMGRGVTQVANSGITISFDYLGREQFRTGKQVEATVITELSMAHRETIYVLFGDYFPWLWFAFLAGGALSRVIAKKRAAL